MKRSVYLTIAVYALCCPGIFGRKWTSVGGNKTFGSWEKILENIYKKERPPAIGGIVILDGKIGRPEAYGMRKYKGKKKVTSADKWHIGSCTKSLTATLVATFVEEGLVTWDTTVEQLLGKKIDVGKEFQNVTFHMLVTNRSGLPEHVPTQIWSDAWVANGKGKIIKARLKFVEDMLNERPASKPGTKYEYSNAGFVTAGAMLEALTGKSWEELMKKRIFEPLGMKSAGFGAPATGTQEDQPWPHTDSKTPVSGAVTDNPAILGPAGTVHVSLVDLAKYVRMHLLQETGPVLKKKATFTFLHAPPKNNNSYACGWFVANRDWAKGHTLSHSGSNTMNFCTIWVAPKIKFASIVVTNTGEKGIGNVCDKAISESIRHFLK